MQNIYTVLKTSEVEVKNIIANVHNHYVPGIQPKKKFGKKQIDKNGKVRKRYLLIPSLDLKSIQQEIHTYLKQFLLPGNMHGAISGKNNIENAKQHLNKKYFFTIDLKDFFTYINYNQVFQMLIKRGVPAPFARTISKLSTYQKSLPQGAPSSPIIANLVFADTVKELNAFIDGKEIVFSNFLDDLCFSSNSDFKSIGNIILDIIRKNKFYPSHNKIHYRIDSCEITGLILRGNSINIISKMREEAKTNQYLKPYVRKIDYENELIQIKALKAIN